MASTMNLGVHRVAADPTWRTPGRVFAELDAEFNFTLDPCASAPIRDGIEWFGETEQGLWREWSGRVFVNPPYGRAIADWMRKITLERARCDVIVGLIPARTDTEWWHEHVMPADEVRFIRGRLSFEGVNAPSGHNAPFPSVIVVWRGSSSLWPTAPCEVLAYQGPHGHRVRGRVVGPFTGPHQPVSARILDTMVDKMSPDGRETAVSRTKSGSGE